MNKARINRTLLGLLLALLASLAGMPSALAAGTLAGTSISNSATVNYQVGGVSQPAINSPAVSFVVDRKINLTVSTNDVAAISVTPGTSGNVLTFTVTNNGNDTQDFALSAIAVSTGGASKFGGNDNIDAGSVAVFVDVNGNGTYEAGTDTATFIDELAPDASKKVFIVATFPTGLNNGDIASYHLLAEARAGQTAGSLGGALTQTAGADTPGSVDVVFADGQGSATASDSPRDAKHSSQSDYKIVAATLTVTKTSAVISDPFNGTTNPKAIPGAVIEFTITITNAAGGATATNITMSDSLNTEIVAGHLAFNTQYNATPGKGILITAPNLFGGAATELTNAADADTGDWNLTAVNTVTVSGITLTASQTATVKFRATIQ
jgi:uncharacterized repeat protein (TIGR01451 family)